MEVLKETGKLLSKSLLFEESKKCDYIDTFSVSLKRSNIDSQELITAFFYSSPKWVDKLFVLRNKLVDVIGLKSEMANIAQLNPPYTKNQQLGAFKIYEITEDEVVLGEDDKHLNFRVSLIIERGTKNRLVLSAIVKTNNLIGKIYFFIIKRFHQIIVSVMIKRMVKNIDK